jgi:hypothetical protein
MDLDNKKNISIICSNLERLILRAVKEPIVKDDKVSEGTGSDFYFCYSQEKIYELPCEKLPIKVILRDYFSESSSGTYSSIGRKNTERRIIIQDLSHDKSIFNFKKSDVSASIYSTIENVCECSKGVISGWSSYSNKEIDLDALTNLTDNLFKLYK